MIINEISSGLIQFRHTCSITIPASEVFRGPFEILLGTNMAPITHTFLQSIIIDAHSQSPGEIVSQENSEHVISDQTVNGWIAYIKEIFYSVPEVESIYFTIEESDVDIWLVIPDRDFDLVRELVDREMQIMSKFASVESTVFLLEFHIVYRCGVDKGRFIPQRAIQIPR